MTAVKPIESISLKKLLISIIEVIGTIIFKLIKEKS